MSTGLQSDDDQALVGATTSSLLTFRCLGAHRSLISSHFGLNCGVPVDRHRDTCSGMY